jgi:acetyltransferase-like isoleucine patch superfamily enzyme
MSPMISKVRLEHVFMLLRGLVWQLWTFRFNGVVLKGRGARIRLDRRVRLAGVLKVGSYATLDLRYTEYGRIGHGFSLGDFSIFRASGSPSFTCPRIEIADNVTFGPFCNLGGGFGLRIGRDVIAGPYVSIHPEEHGMSPDHTIRTQQISGKGIAIENDCWLGAKATILDGSHLEEGTVIGAAALVAGIRTAPKSVYVGIPARRVHGRSDVRQGKRQ